MPQDAFQVVYDKNDIAINAMLLVRGELVFVITEKHYFTVRGENIIFGAGEVLFGIEHNSLQTRLVKVYSKEGAEVRPIPNKNLTHYIGLYNIGFNITKFVAECVRKSNEILGGLNRSIAAKDTGARRFYKFYYAVVSRMRERAREVGSPTLDLFLDQKEETLAFRKGKVFSDVKPDDISVESRKLDEFTTEYAAGSVLCRQDEKASNLFVLKRGRINVLLNGEEIYTISRPGTVFGEMSLFLDEPRSATLLAGEDSVVTVIDKTRLQAVATNVPDFFNKIAITLWERLRNNVTMIREFENLNAEKARLDLRILADELTALYRSEKINWLLAFKDEIGNAL